MKNAACSQTSRRTFADHSPRVYASRGDFCAIFSEETDSLYALALVLTGNHETAQQCFLAALDDCLTGNSVFPEWARSWSRRAVIKNAIRLLDPALTNADGAPEAGLEAIVTEMDASARHFLQLARFDRFVFVITVLEGYATRECAALLGCNPRAVAQARVRALQLLADAVRDKAPAPYDNTFATEKGSVLTH